LRRRWFLWNTKKSTSKDVCPQTGIDVDLCVVMYRSQISKQVLTSVWERVSGVGTWCDVALCSREWLQSGRNCTHALWSGFHTTHVLEKQGRGNLSKVKSRVGGIDAEIPTDLLPVVCWFCVSVLCGESVLC
jgi:hypothetical protein